MRATPSVEVEDPERMSLLGLMLAGLVRDNLGDPSLAGRAARLEGSLGVTAGRMKVTLVFDRGAIRVRRGLDPDLGACVTGSLAGLMRVSLGHGVLGAVLRGGTRVRGNPFFALRVMPLFRAPAAREDGR